MKHATLAVIAVVIVGALGGMALAQFGRDEFRGGLYHPLPNIAYDGRFTFVRVRYDPAPGGSDEPPVG